MLKFQHNLIGLNKGLTTPNSNDAGLLINKVTSDKNAFMGWDATNNKFVMGLTSSGMIVQEN